MLVESVEHDMYVRLGAMIKTARLKAQINQDTLADFLGLSRISIVKIEQGKQRIQVHTLCQLVNYLRIPASELFESLNISDNLHVDKSVQKNIAKETDKEGAINKIKEFLLYTSKLK